MCFESGESYKYNRIIDIGRDFTDQLVQSFHNTDKRTTSQEDEITCTKSGRH